MSRNLERRINTVRWGDELNVPWVVGQTTRTTDLFRIKAPFPTCWRVICNVLSTSLPNLAVGVTLNLGIGIGATSFEYPVVFAQGVILNFEFPAQSCWGWVSGGAALASCNMIARAQVAPLVPWEGLRVEVEHDSVHGENGWNWPPDGGQQ
jgi:hypothetical protein